MQDMQQTAFILIVSGLPASCGLSVNWGFFSAEVVQVSSCLGHMTAKIVRQRPSAQGWGVLSDSYYTFTPGRRILTCWSYFDASRMCWLILNVVTEDSFVLSLSFWQKMQVSQSMGCTELRSSTGWLELDALVSYPPDSPLRSVHNKFDLLVKLE